MAKGNSNAQNAHANGGGNSVDAHLSQWDIVDSFGSVDASAVNGTAMYFGNGNSPDHYHLQQNNTLGIELGLKEHYRTGDDILPTSVDADGTANFIAPAGTQTPG